MYSSNESDVESVITSFQKPKEELKSEIKDSDSQSQRSSSSYSRSRSNSSSRSKSNSRSRSRSNSSIRSRSNSETSSPGSLRNRSRSCSSTKDGDKFEIIRNTTVNATDSRVKQNNLNITSNKNEKGRVNSKSVPIHKSFEKYLDKNEKRKITKIGKPFPIKNDINSDDEEVFIMQCSQSINIKSLLNQEIDLSGKSFINADNSIELKTEKCMDNKPITIIYSNDKFSEQLTPTIIKSAGKITARKNFKIKSPKKEKPIIDLNDIEKPVPFPDNLKIRHPLLGADYTSQLELSAMVLSRLKKTRGRSKKTAQTTNDTMDQSEQVEVSECLVPKKKTNKRKLDQSQTDMESEIPENCEPKKKKIKSEKVKKIKTEQSADSNGDISNDLEWLTQI